MFAGRLGGHEESLRRSCGDAAGTELGTDLVNARMVNVGSVMVSPYPPLLGRRAGSWSAEWHHDVAESP